MKLFGSHKNELDDAGLLHRYRSKGDSESLGLLYDRYLHLIYGLCLKYLKSREEAQDAVMDLYEVLAEKLQRQEVQHFKSWLYIVSKNHCLMLLRKSQRQAEMNNHFMELEVEEHPNEEKALEEDLVALEKCIEQLRDDQKRCVQLFFLKKKSYVEISEEHQMAIKKVKSYIQNGKRNLKICLESQHVRR